MEKTELYNMVDHIGLYMDNEELLTAMVMALDSDTLEDLLAFIVRVHGLADIQPLNKLKEGR